MIKQAISGWVDRHPRATNTALAVTTGTIAAFYLGTAGYVREEFISLAHSMRFLGLGMSAYTINYAVKAIDPNASPFYELYGGLKNLGTRIMGKSESIDHVSSLDYKPKLSTMKKI